MKRSTVRHPYPLSFATAASAIALLLASGACASRSQPVAAPQPNEANTGTTQVATAAPAAAAAPVPAAAPQPARPSGPPPLTGLVTRTAIESFNDVWKGLRAQDYEPDAAAVAAIRDASKDVEVFAVVATWCPDSRRDLPRFFKIADRAGWTMEKVTLLAVDRTKKDAGGLTGKWNVTRVPTFIFLRAGREIGRVIERPATTLERDIAGILTGR